MWNIVVMMPIREEFVNKNGSGLMMAIVEVIGYEWSIVLWERVKRVDVDNKDIIKMLVCECE